MHSSLRVCINFLGADPHTVYPKKYAHGFCFAVLCCGYTLTDFPISIRLTSLALWQSNDCPNASKATLMNMDKYFMWIHYERLHNHNKAKHNKTVCIFHGIYFRYETHTWSILCLKMASQFHGQCHQQPQENYEIKTILFPRDYFYYLFRIRFRWPVGIFQMTFEIHRGTSRVKADKAENSSREIPSKWFFFEVVLWAVWNISLLQHFELFQKMSKVAKT